MFVGLKEKYKSEYRYACKVHMRIGMLAWCTLRGQLNYTFQFTRMQSSTSKVASNMPM